MSTVTIQDIPVTRELSDDDARKIAGGMINQREGGADAPRPSEPSGGMGYTGILIHYTLTVIE
jgi:hypothetical protein